MPDRGLIDAALIAVPHYDHPKYAIECFKRGIHVMTEKPAGVFARQVREMNEAVERSDVKFAIMFNQRSNPLFTRARKIVQSGQFGSPKHLVWIVTNRYRTWRITIRGAGVRPGTARAAVFCSIRYPKIPIGGS